MLEVNLRALRARDPAGVALRRFAALGQLLTGAPAADGGEASAWVRALCQELDVPGLRAYGMSEADVGDLVAKAKVASSMRANRSCSAMRS